MAVLGSTGFWTVRDQIELHSLSEPGLRRNAGASGQRRHLAPEARASELAWFAASKQFSYLLYRGDGDRDTG